MRNIVILRNIATLSLGVAVMIAQSASAETRWEKTHPRRDQVNDRIAHQQLRITREKREGEITSQQAKALRANDHAIREQERAYASTQNGHITKEQQKELNQQLNANSKAIGR